MAAVAIDAAGELQGKSKNFLKVARSRIDLPAWTWPIQ